MLSEVDDEGIRSRGNALRDLLRAGAAKPLLGNLSHSATVSYKPVISMRSEQQLLIFEYVNLFS
jgi:hypothetical protein